MTIWTEAVRIKCSKASIALPKRIVNFGAYVLIFPDAKYFNTINLEDVGSIDRLFSVSGSSVTLQMCRGDGTNYDMSQISVGTTPPSSPANSSPTKKSQLLGQGSSDPARHVQL